MSKFYFDNILGRLTVLGLLGFMVSGCTVVPGRDPGSSVSLTVPSSKAQSDSSTQIVPHNIYMETPEGKAVLVSSEVQAKLNGCTNMQRYRIRSNTDFLSTLHLFKYRAALMGAKRIVITQHIEMDRKEFYSSSDMLFTHTREGTTLESSNLFTSLTADIYDCKG